MSANIRRALSVAAGVTLLLGLGGCVYPYGPYYDDYYGPYGYGGPHAAFSYDDCDDYDDDCDYLGYYDGYYGPFFGGYWANDGFFYYYDHHRRYHRDHERHFRHGAFDGGKPLYWRRGEGHREWRRHRD